MATVVGRDRELEAIGSFLDAAPTAARLLLVEGEPGIGKTTLWRAGVDAARARGFLVLSCEAARSETQLALTSVRDLLADAFDEVADELPPPQRRALEVVLLREEPQGSPPEPDTVAFAFLSTLRLLASRGPTLLAIDDVQWLDSASAAALTYALRRLDTEALAVLLARRTDGDEPWPLELDRPHRVRLEVITLGPLTMGALGRVLHERLGAAQPRPVLHRLYEVSGGNPFYALELARALGDAPRRLAPGAPLPIPQTLRELIQERLLALPARTLDALTVASALLRPTLAVVGAALGLDAEALLGPAIDAQIAAVEREEIQFAHPLFAEAAYGLARFQRRREIHRDLAEVVGNVEERARHLALGTDEPDDAVAQTLEEGAQSAFRRGSPGAAADLAAEARRLTPGDATVDSWRRSLAEADYLFAAGDTARASALLDDLAGDTPPGALRARVLSRQARLHHFERDLGRSVDLLYKARAEAGDDAALRAEVEEGLAWGLLLIRRDLPAALEHARSAARFAERQADLAMLAEGLAAQAVTELVLGYPWRETMNRALAFEEATLSLRVLRQPSFAYGYCLSCADELEEARDVFHELLRRTQQQGDESSVPSILNHLTIIECLAGDWTASMAHADECFERALESGQRPTQASVLGKKALLEARRGALEDARETALQALGIAGEADFDPSTPHRAFMHGGETAVWAFGFSELSRGDAESAHAWLGPQCDALLASGLEEPGEVRALPDEIEALVVLGRVEDADVHTRRLEAWAHRLERPSVLGTAGRCRGLLLAAGGDDAAALATFEEAASWHERAQVPFERGRTLLALGAQQRRARQRKAARETLQRTEALFVELGSELWADKARAELARIGGRAPSAGELTPTERRIAELVAEGQKNKEVAATLVVTERTVEAALTQIYRKLDVRSRTELARKLAESKD
jgi:DNA-binding CsgD family transcriptional regulator